MSVNYENESCMTTVHDFTSLLVNAGLKSLKLKVGKRNFLPHKNNDWFDDSCYQSRLNLRKQARQVKKNSYHKTDDFQNECKKFKKLVKDNNSIREQ